MSQKEQKNVPKGLEEKASAASTPESVGVLVRYLKLGKTLLHLIQESGLFESLSARYQSPGSTRATGEQIFSELQQTHPEIIFEIYRQAQLLDFSLERHGARENIVSAAMRQAGIVSGRWLSDAELQVLFDNAGKLTDLQLSRLLPGRAPESICMLRLELGLPSTEQLWTDDEERLLEQYFDEGLTDEEISSRLGNRTTTAVAVHRNRMGLINRVWDESNDDVLRELVLAGKTQAQIAESMGVSTSTVSRHVAKLGLFQRRITPEEVDEIFRLGRNGHSITEIANILNFSPEVIGYRVKQKGLSPQTLDQWVEEDAQALAQGYAEGLSDEQIADSLNRPVWQIKYYKFSIYGFRFLDEYEGRLVWLSEYEGAYQPLAKYLHDQVKMSYAEINNRFQFAASRVDLLKAVNNYTNKEGNLGWRHMTHWKLMDVIALHKQRMSSPKGNWISDADIAKEIGRGPTTVNSYIQRILKGERRNR